LSEKFFGEELSGEEYTSRKNNFSEELSGENFSGDEVS
jgi:hypothetical protein